MNFVTVTLPGQTEQVGQTVSISLRLQKHQGQRSMDLDGELGISLNRLDLSQTLVYQLWHQTSILQMTVLSLSKIRD